VPFGDAYDIREHLVGSVYDESLGYEIAFSYRDVPAEVDALIAMAGGTPRSVLEIAAGPAEHAIEFARRGARAAALDLSEAMCARATANAAAAGVELDVIRADMRDFSAPYQVDLAYCMISSISHVPTLDDMISHLAAVRRALGPGGCYIIEGNHPTEQFGAKATGTNWEAESDGITVHLRWGADDDRIDPVTQLTDVHVTLTMTGPDGTSVTTRHVESDRFWTPDEMRASARLAGLGVSAEYGAFDRRGLSADGAWRMITVMRPAWGAYRVRQPGTSAARRRRP
jgi:SAM-dependent methyltransferase